ncbi:MAG: hypothetical protein WAV38_38975 [Xanthobacteraceae bacterium]
MKRERVTCDERLVLRVPAALRDRLEEAAAEKRRSLADLTRIVLMDWVAAQTDGDGDCAA